MNTIPKSASITMFSCFQQQLVEYKFLYHYVNSYFIITLILSKFVGQFMKDLDHMMQFYTGGGKCLHFNQSSVNHNKNITPINFHLL